MDKLRCKFYWPGSVITAYHCIVCKGYKRIRLCVVIVVAKRSSNENYIFRFVCILVFSICWSVGHCSDAFTLVSDTNGVMVKARFDDYLRQLLTLPAAIFEGPSFEFSDNASRNCFDGRVSNFRLLNFTIESASR